MEYCKLGQLLRILLWHLSACFAPPLAGADDRICQIFPSGRSSRSVGPGIEIRDDPSERVRLDRELDDMTSLE